mmetsp:Transcript_11106/g.20192  ORF Transcript_11106/g.20192 Transcript_11106/m.20192 type:complete len:92 (+) Transcript_11106:39-314(+)
MVYDVEDGISMLTLTRNPPLEWSPMHGSQPIVRDVQHVPSMWFSPNRWYRELPTSSMHYLQMSALWHPRRISPMPSTLPESPEARPIDCGL